MSSELSSEPHQRNISSASRFTNLQTSNRRLFLFSLVTILLAALVTLFLRDTANLFIFRRFFGYSSRAASSLEAASISTPVASLLTEQLGSKMKTPVYFLSHGGVSFVLSLIGIVSCATTCSQWFSPTLCMTWSIRRTRSWDKLVARSRRR